MKCTVYKENTHEKNQKNNLKLSLCATFEQSQHDIFFLFDLIVRIEYYIHILSFIHSDQCEYTDTLVPLFFNPHLTGSGPTFIVILSKK